MTNAEFSKNFAHNFAKNTKSTKSTDEVCQAQKIQMGERTLIPSLLVFFWHIQNAWFWQGIFLCDEDKKKKKGTAMQLGFSSMC